MRFNDRITHLVFLSLLQFLGAHPSVFAFSNAQVIDRCQDDSKACRVLVFGDQGTGFWEQMRIAYDMYKHCHPNKINTQPSLYCDLALVTGDNFYVDGVTDEKDPQFKQKFEDPYAPLKIPIYASLGNHDWGVMHQALSALAKFHSGGIRGNGNAQVGYSQKSPWWRMAKADPDALGVYYYFDSKHIRFIALDGTYLTQKQADWLKVHAYQGQQQGKWVLVYSHYPLYSFDDGGDEDWFVDMRLKAGKVLCDHADLFIAGHDHGSQIMKIDCSEVSSNTAPLYQLVTGAAGYDFRGGFEKEIPSNKIKKNNLTIELLQKQTGIGFAHLVVPAKGQKTGLLQLHGWRVKAQGPPGFLESLAPNFDVSPIEKVIEKNNGSIPSMPQISFQKRS